MKTKIKKTIIIFILLIITIFIMWISLGGTADNMSNGLSTYFDFYSILFIVLPTCVILLFADILSDYIRAYKVVWGNLDYTTKELKTSVEAMNLSIKSVNISAIIGVIIGIIGLLTNLSTSIQAYQSIPVIMITMLYALLFNLIQYAVKAKINKELIYRGN